MCDFKICPECGKKFTKEDYMKSAWGNDKQKEFHWRHRKYCSYDCSNKFHAKRSKEKQLTKIIQHPLNFTAPIKIKTVKEGCIEEVDILLYGEWKRCIVKDVEYEK